MARQIARTFEIGEKPHSTIKTLIGRDAWALERLIAAGEYGVTPVDDPAPRWSHYVFNLRTVGIKIETRTEPNRGVFGGTHGRYILRSSVRVIVTADAG